MAAALFGIFAVVLQISGTFSSRPLPDYDRTGRFWLRKPEAWDYMTLQDLKDFYSHPRSPVEKDFKYQLLPSSWINDKRDSVIKFGQQMPSDNAAASGSATPSSIPKSKTRLAHLRNWPRESRKGLLPKILPRPRPIVMNNSILSSTDQNKIKDGSSLGLQQGNVQPSKREDDDLTINTLHATISTENLRIENTTVQEYTDEKVTIEKETSQNKLDDGATSEITPTEEGKKENTDVEDETTTPLEHVKSETTSDNSVGSKETVFTESHSTSTSDGQENSSYDTTETADSSKTSILEETTLFVSVSSSEATPTTLPDTSPSEGTTSTTHPPTSPTGGTYSRVSGESTDASTKDASSAYTSTESKSSKSVTEVVSEIPEHVISISSIKKAKIAITVVFLVIGLIGVAVLAIYVFRERRKAVQYDQLTLLP